MMRNFLKHTLEIETQHDLSSAKRILYECVRSSDICEINCANSSEHALVIVTKSDNMFFYNSFAPLVNVRFLCCNSKTKIVADFEIRKSVRTILCFYNAGVCGLELMLLYFLAVQNLATPYLLLLPVLLVSFSLCITYIGFKISQNSLQKLIHSAYKKVE